MRWERMIVVLLVADAMALSIPAELSVAVSTVSIAVSSVNSIAAMISDGHLIEDVVSANVLLQYYRISDYGYAREPEQRIKTYLDYGYDDMEDTEQHIKSAWTHLLQAEKEKPSMCSAFNALQCVSGVRSMVSHLAAGNQEAVHAGQSAWNKLKNDLEELDRMGADRTECVSESHDAFAGTARELEEPTTSGLQPFLSAMQKYGHVYVEGSVRMDISDMPVDASIISYVLNHDYVKILQAPNDYSTHYNALLHANRDGTALQKIAGMKQRLMRAKEQMKASQAEAVETADNALSITKQEADELAGMGVELVTERDIASLEDKHFTAARKTPRETKEFMEDEVNRLSGLTKKAEWIMETKGNDYVVESTLLLESISSQATHLREEAKRARQELLELESLGAAWCENHDASATALIAGRVKRLCAPTGNAGSSIKNYAEAKRLIDMEADAFLGKDAEKELAKTRALLDRAGKDMDTRQEKEELAFLDQRLASEMPAEIALAAEEAGQLRERLVERARREYASIPLLREQALAITGYDAEFGGVFENGLDYEAAIGQLKIMKAHYAKIIDAFDAGSRLEERTTYSFTEAPECGKEVGCVEWHAVFNPTPLPVAAYGSAVEPFSTMEWEEELMVVALECGPEERSVWIRDSVATVKSRRTVSSLADTEGMIAFSTGEVRKQLEKGDNLVEAVFTIPVAVDAPVLRSGYDCWVPVRMNCGWDNVSVIIDLPFTPKGQVKTSSGRVERLSEKTVLVKGVACTGFGMEFTAGSDEEDSAEALEELDRLLMPLAGEDAEALRRKAGALRSKDAGTILLEAPTLMEEAKRLRTELAKTLLEMTKASAREEEYLQASRFMEAAGILGKDVSRAEALAAEASALKNAGEFSAATTLFSEAASSVKSAGVERALKDRKATLSKEVDAIAKEAKSMRADATAMLSAYELAESCFRKEDYACFLENAEETEQLAKEIRGLMQSEREDVAQRLSSISLDADEERLLKACSTDTELDVIIPVSMSERDCERLLSQELKAETVQEIEDLERRVENAKQRIDSTISSLAEKAWEEYDAAKTIMDETEDYSMADILSKASESYNAEEYNKAFIYAKYAHSRTALRKSAATGMVSLEWTPLVLLPMAAALVAWRMRKKEDKPLKRVISRQISD
ncbi:MAG: hypothetical protein JW834_02895 [Candidatus Diapherotrites archaeon]|nr:hypothetical protein [Candidatus Diapherotrites archaeon]